MLSHDSVGQRVYYLSTLEMETSATAIPNSSGVWGGWKNTEDNLGIVGNVNMGQHVSFFTFLTVEAVAPKESPRGKQ